MPTETFSSHPHLNCGQLQTSGKASCMPSLEALVARLFDGQICKQPAATAATHRTGEQACHDLLTVVLECRIPGPARPLCTPPICGICTSLAATRHASYPLQKLKLQSTFMAGTMPCDGYDAKGMGLPWAPPSANPAY